jgi:hypothetical protein
MGSGRSGTGSWETAALELGAVGIAGEERAAWARARNLTQQPWRWALIEQGKRGGGGGGGATTGEMKLHGEERRGRTGSSGELQMAGGASTESLGASCNGEQGAGRAQQEARTRGARAQRAAARRAPRGLGRETREPEAEQREEDERGARRAGIHELEEEAGRSAEDCARDKTEQGAAGFFA